MFFVMLSRAIVIQDSGVYHVVHCVISMFGICVNIGKMCNVYITTISKWFWPNQNSACKQNADMYNVHALVSVFIHAKHRTSNAYTKKEINYRQSNFIRIQRHRKNFQRSEWTTDDSSLKKGKKKCSNQLYLSRLSATNFIELCSNIVYAARMHIAPVTVHQLPNPTTSLA